MQRPTTGFRLSAGGGVRLRPASTDLKVFDEVYLEQIYAPAVAAALRIQQRIRQQNSEAQLTVVDLGANIGLSIIYLLQALPGWRGVAVEPDPGNYMLLGENLYLTHLQSRCKTLQGFVGATAGLAELVDSGNGAWGMRMGAASKTGTPVFPLKEILDRAGFSEISLLKCDIEGSERDLFATIRDWDDKVRWIMLELHADLFPVQEFLACLEASHYHWRIHGTISDQSCLSVIGLERGAERAPLIDLRSAPQARGTRSQTASFVP